MLRAFVSIKQHLIGCCDRIRCTNVSIFNAAVSFEGLCIRNFYKASMQIIIVCKFVCLTINLFNIMCFLQKCLTFMDRGYVFKLINSYMDKFNPGDPKTLYDYKFVFLQLVCSHEHYIAFNLPLLYPSLGTSTRSGECIGLSVSQRFTMHSKS